jgi:putative oxidoreductase
MNAAGQERGPRKGTAIFRVAFGLFWIASGLTGLLGLVPPPSTSAAGLFLAGLGAAGYLLPLMCLVQVLAGALILSPRLAPLGLTVLAPVMVQVLAFRLFLGAPRMLPIALALTAAHVYLAWRNRAAFSALFRWSPTSAPGPS